MSEAAKVARVSVKGGFNLLWGMVVSTVISSIGTILVARLLLPSEYGLYAVALTAPSLVSNFTDWGINAATIKYSAQYSSEDQRFKIRKTLFSGLLFVTTLSLSLSILLITLSDFLAKNVFQRPEVAPLIQIASLIILSGALLSIAQAAFVGMERMELNNIALISQSTIKTFLVVTLSVLGFGTFGVVVGYTVAFMIAGSIGIFLMMRIYMGLPRGSDTYVGILSNIKTMFRYGLPLSLATICSGFLTQFYNFVLAIYATDFVIGNYTLANSFVVLIAFFATPVTTMMFPAFSKLNWQKDQATIRNVFQFSIKYSALLVTPVAALVIALSRPAVVTLFGDKYGIAPTFLALLAVAYLYSAFGNLCIGSFINGQGHTTFSLKLMLLTSSLGFPLGFVMISQFGVIGLITTTLVAGLPSLIISLHWVKKNYTLAIDWISSAKILLSSAASAALTYAVTSQLNLSSWIILIIGLFIFLPLFVAAILLTKTITRVDIDSLRNMVKDLGTLNRLFHILFNILENLMRLISS